MRHPPAVKTAGYGIQETRRFAFTAAPARNAPASRTTCTAPASDRPKSVASRRSSPPVSARPGRAPRPAARRIFDPVPRAVAADDKPMRRANPQLFLDQQEVATDLGPVRRPDPPRRFPRTCDRMQLLPYPIRKRPRMRSSPCRPCYRWPAGSNGSDHLKENSHATTT